MLRKRPRNSLATVASVAALCAVVLLVSEAESLESSPPHAPAETDRIAKSIKQLDSNRFAERTEASRYLESVGKAACPALAEAALGQSREVTLRAIDILRKQLKGGDVATKEAAKEALKKIADSDHESAARRAKDALDPKPPAQMPAAPGIQIAPQIQIQINAAAGRRQARRIRINNGVKEIEADDNGRKIKITEDPVGGIRMEVSEKRDGKETTQKYAAKTADELKKKHPDAHKIYEEYAKQLGGGIQIRAVQVQPGAVPPIQIQPGQARERVLRKSAALRLRHARRIVEMAVKQLQPLKEAGESTEELKNSVKRLEEIAQELQEEEAKLDKDG